MKTVLKIGYRTFEYCLSLTSNIIPSIVKEYGELAILKETNENTKEYRATFRSPLRKIRDCFTIRQMVALSVKMTKQEMMYFVNGYLSEDNFKQFVKRMMKTK